MPTAIRLDPVTMEVFAWVGVSLAWAQALERTLSAYLLLARTLRGVRSGRRLPRKQFRAALENLADEVAVFREHAEWLRTAEENLDELRKEARIAATTDPTLALEIAEMMEDIESRI